MIKIFNRRHPGFTLIETLIAILVMALLLLIVLSSYLASQQSYTQTDNRAELTQNGRVILDRLERELRQAVTIVTILPADNSNPATIPHEIFFEDGHNTNQLTYLRYFLDGTDLRRQSIVYYFTADPTNYVHYNDTDAYGQSPQSQILSDGLVGEYVTVLNFYGQGVTTIALQLTKDNKTINLQTQFYGRNL